VFFFQTISFTLYHTPSTCIRHVMLCSYSSFGPNSCRAVQSSLEVFLQQSRGSALRDKLDTRRGKCRVFSRNWRDCCHVASSDWTYTSRYVRSNANNDREDFRFILIRGSWFSEQQWDGNSVNNFFPAYFRLHFWNKPNRCIVESLLDFSWHKFICT